MFFQPPPSAPQPLRNSPHNTQREHIATVAPPITASDSFYNQTPRKGVAVLPACLKRPTQTSQHALSDARINSRPNNSSSERQRAQRVYKKSSNYKKRRAFCQRASSAVTKTVGLGPRASAVRNTERFSPPNVKHTRQNRVFTHRVSKSYNFTVQ